MKHLKKFAGVVLAIMIAFAMSIPAFAAQEGTQTAGTITITNAKSNQTYNVYQLMYLESYNKDAGTYTYKANSAWETWLKTQTSYVSFDAQGYITAVASADMETFAKLALAEAKRSASGISPDKTESTGTTTTTEATSNLVISGLTPGYFLIDTTTGTLCSLTTNNPDVTVDDKNYLPTLDKQVEEGGNFGNADSYAKIGDTVKFKIIVAAKKGAENYVIHDELSDGFTLDTGSFVVKAGEATLTGNGTDYTLVSSGLLDNCDFEIRFEQTYLNSITTDTTITVEYSAKLDKDAAISTAANTNTAKLSYGDSSKTSYTTPDTTNTYSFKFDIVKTDSSKKLLDGAGFKLYDSANGGSQIKVVKDGDVYRVADATETTADDEIMATGGKATVIGLDKTTYYLAETTVPAGYNQLSARVPVDLSSGNNTTNMTGDTWADGNGGIQITNNAGSILPGTGGIGTTIFYVVGGSVIAVALVLLVVRKRRQSKVAD